MYSVEFSLASQSCHALTKYESPVKRIIVMHSTFFAVTYVLWAKLFIEYMHDFVYYLSQMLYYHID